MKRFLVAIAALMIAQPVLAQQAFPTLGGGNNTCAEWNAARSADRARNESLGSMSGYLLGWMQGFLTGTNAVLVSTRNPKSVLTLPSSATVIATMDAECLLMPEQRILYVGDTILVRYVK